VSLAAAALVVAVSLAAALALALGAAATAVSLAAGAAVVASADAAAVVVVAAPPAALADALALGEPPLFASNGIASIALLGSAGVRKKLYPKIPPSTTSVIAAMVAIVFKLRICFSSRQLHNALISCV